jgi:hypothetical protein
MSRSSASSSLAPRRTPRAETRRARAVRERYRSTPRGVLFYLSVRDERREGERCGRVEFSCLSRKTGRYLPGPADRLHVATHVATQAVSSVTQRHVADRKHGRGEPKRPLAAHREPSATTVRDREAPGSNPGPPTKIRTQSWRHGLCQHGAGSQPDHNFQRQCSAARSSHSPSLRSSAGAK